MKLNQDQIKKTDEILFNLVLENMKAGASFEKSQEQAFNRMNKEYPLVLAAWLEAKK